MEASEQALIEKIKQKPEFLGLDDSIVLSSLQKFLKKIKATPAELKPREEKIVVKHVRAELRTLSGQFEGGIKERKKLSGLENVDELLKTHTSTSERLDFYPELKKFIKSLKVRSILDLGCGLNPLVLANPEIEYYASDIRKDELDLISNFFKKNNIRGKTFIFDLRTISESSNLPKTDFCLLLKVLDIIEENSHKLAEKVISLVPSKKILISFPTKKLSGRPMNFPKRIWLEKMLERLNYPFKRFYSSNEIFYFVEKSS